MIILPSVEAREKVEISEISGNVDVFLCCVFYKQGKYVALSKLRSDVVEFSYAF